MGHHGSLLRPAAILEAQINATKWFQPRKIKIAKENVKLYKVRVDSHARDAHVCW